MCVSQIKIATTIVLTALAGYFTMQAGHSSASVIPPLEKDAAQTVDPTDPLFPDGVEYDFGKVQRGPVAYHAFRIVNTTMVPLRLLSLRNS
jgi:hypothetical protein